MFPKHAEVRIIGQQTGQIGGTLTPTGASVTTRLLTDVTKSRASGQRVRRVDTARPTSAGIRRNPAAGVLNTTITPENVNRGGNISGR